MMGTPDAPDKSRGVSFQLAIDSVSYAKTTGRKLRVFFEDISVTCAHLLMTQVA